MPTLDLGSEVRNHSVGSNLEHSGHLDNEAFKNSVHLLNHICFPEPLPSWQQANVDSDEARLSPQAGRLIHQLLDEDSDPMLSPRFYAYGQSRQYLDDTEVPPSPPNSHSFMRYVPSNFTSHMTLEQREGLAH